MKELASTIEAGDYKAAMKLVQDGLKQGIEAEEIISKGLAKGMMIAAKKYESKGMYIDMIFRSARAFTLSLMVAEGKLKKKVKSGRVLLGVLGGPWTIGKDVVNAVLKANGFETFDAGSNVPPEVVADKAAEFKPEIIATAIFLSQSDVLLKQLEEELTKRGIRHKVRTILSGPAANQRMAEQYGYDSYAKDAVAIAEKAKVLVNELKSEMTSLDRVMTTLRHKEPDRVPFVPFTATFAAHFAGIPYGLYCKSGKAMAEAQAKTQRYFGYDATVVTSDMVREVEDLGGKIVRPDDEVPYFEKKLLDLQSGTIEKDFHNLKTPDPRKGYMGEQVKAVEIIRKELGPDVPIIGWTEGPFQGTTALMGCDETALYLMEQNPDLLREMIEFHMELEVEFAEAQVEAGANIIGNGETGAYFTSPEMFQNWALPFEKEVYKKINKLGVPVLIHCCGFVPQNIKYAPEVNLGGAIQFDYQVNLAWAKKLIGEKITIMGNLESNILMARESPDKVARACERAISIAGPGGGYWLSAGCEIAKMTTVENMRTIVRTCKTFGKYPLQKRAKKTSS